MTSNPKLMALVSGAVAAWQIYSVMTATEQPSTALAVLQYVIIAAALIGCIGSLKQVLSEKPPAN